MVRSEEKFISVPMGLLLRLKMIAASHAESAEVDLLLGANRERIDRRMREQRWRRTEWAYQRLWEPFRQTRPDLSEAQARLAFKFSTDHRRRLAEAYEALLVERGQSPGL